MAKFCTKCGSALTGVFCVKCGADMRQSATPAPQPVPQNPGITAPKVDPAPPPLAIPSTPAGPAVVQPAMPKQGMGTLAKLGIAAVAIIFVGGAAGAVGVYYVAHKVSQKYHEVSDGILGSSSDSDRSRNSSSAGSKASASSDNSLGNVCRFLSKEDVSKAIGIEIVRTEPGDNGCSYIAKGTAGDMMAKHATSMMAARGADKKTQQVIQTFAGGMGKMFESETPESERDTSGEVPVFSFSVDQNSADAQMRLNAKVLGNLGSQEGVPGIGDQAFVSAEGMMFVRKGKSLVRILYLSCPCGTEQVKPLAKEIADAL